MVTDLLLRYPQAGAVTDDPTIRRLTTTPYPYLIFYVIGRGAPPSCYGTMACASLFGPWPIAS